MTDIRRYVIVDANDNEWDRDYDQFDQAQSAAILAHEPLAIIARVYEYADSELLWSTTEGDACTIWPPPPEQLTIDDSEDE